MAGFDDLAFHPGDPIFHITELFLADERPGPVNLGVGIYLDGDGHLPLPAAVAEAERRIAAQPGARGYLPMTGMPTFVAAAQRVVFGDGAAVLDEGRVAAIQALGGSGALKVAAELARAGLGATRAVVSDPTWANHVAILEGAGFQVGTYRYHDAAGHRVDVDAMVADLASLEPGTVVVLHACCHNPTGYDLAADDWRRVAEACRAGGLLPLVDMAYQGFADGLEADRLAVDVFVASGQRFLVANSFSKNLGLYGERVGALSVVCASADEARRVTSQMARLVRTIYSNPPTHGARIVSMVLDDDELRPQWLDELDVMRRRIRTMRERLVAELAACGVDDMGFITDQRGMFSYCGLDVAQMHRLRDDHAVYGTDDGRLCIAGLNDGNVQAVAKAIAAVR